MPYLRITCPQIDAPRRRAIATSLTDAVIELFFNPRAPVTREQLRERTTVHFCMYGDAELFIGGRTPDERGVADVTVELSDWSMSVGMQRRIAAQLTPLLGVLFNVREQDIDNLNIRFHSYSPAAFAVGGKLLSDIVPRFGRFMKRLSS
ncbi:MAG: hypothetical protein JO193_07790 [Candidatus Eremiobacteraeota bacterium]|nr:hypothetical protein [Candidatus Eremiobacteraeota bacterium]